MIWFSESGSSLGLLLAACFAAGAIDSIAGGGGLITVPALLSAGVPPAFLLGTNKSVSSCGSSVAVWRYARAGIMPSWPPMAWAGLIALAVAGGVAGATVSQISAVVANLRMTVPFLLLAVMVVLARHWFFSGPPGKVGGSAPTEGWCPMALFSEAAPGVGPIAFYDGLLGPGTGTFLLMFFERRKLPTLSANSATKVFNLSSNVGALTFFALHGRVIWALGLTCAGANMLGNLLGSTLVIRRGQNLVRAGVLLVTSALLLRLIFQG